MNNVKMCVRCNAAIISNLHDANADYYRHLSVKYCDECRKITEREQTARRLKRYRERKKQNRTLKQEQNSYLKAENEMMKRNYVQLCEAIEVLQRELSQIRAEADRL